jgi:hypothetical protein
MFDSDITGVRTSGHPFLMGWRGTALSRETGMDTGTMSFNFGSGDGRQRVHEKGLERKNILRLLSGQ